MNKTKYIKARDFQPHIIDTKAEVYKFACCDCGLVHFMKMEIIDDSLVKLIFAQDKQATAQLRRHEYGSLQKENKRKKYSLVKL